MRRRSRASSKPTKARSRKAEVSKRRSSSATRGGSSDDGQGAEIARLSRELNEALERQTATAEILKIISASPTELQSVLGIVAKSAARFCEANDVSIFELDGQDLRSAAHWGPVPSLDIGVRFPCSRGHVAGRIVLERRPVHVIDLQAEAEEFPEGSAFAKRLGHRTILGAPLLREGVAIGSIQLRRIEAHPFTDRQISLLETFAAQAVIAIENARLLNELRQRTSDLTEALEQQTATSDVLRVISSSPGELQPVFHTILENAIRICEASFGNLLLREGDVFRRVASHNAPPNFAAFMAKEPLIHRRQSRSLNRIIEIKQADHIADMTVDEPETPIAKFGGARTLVTVPLIKENEVIGAFGIYRQEVRPFTDKQIELLKNFAAQAVIAIENARLLNELRQSLQQQTAMTEVLGVISSSPGELEPVFQNLLDNATRLCAADFGLMARYNGGAFQLMAQLGGDPAYVEYLQREPFRPGPETLSGRVLQSRGSVQIEDFAKSKGYLDRDPIVVVAVERGGVRTTLGVPMLKENELIGIISLYRQEVRLFTDKQIELLQNFAAQAVIAIENARLLNELRESLEQQTATSDVLRVISNSPTNVQPVFDSIAESAVRLCSGEFSFVVRFDGKVMDFASHFGLSAEGLDAFRSMMPRPAGEDTASGRAILRRAVVEVPDVNADDAYGMQAQGLARAAIYRSIVGVPLLHEGNPIGAITVARASAGRFPERQIAVLRAFADQAVIAIRNVRLFDEVQSRSEELSESLQQQTATADVLKVISRSTFDLKNVLKTLVESAARLCEADTVALSRPKGTSYHFEATFGTSREFDEYVATHPVLIERGTAVGRTLLEGKIVHIPDVLADPEYTYTEAQRLGGYRTLLGVPLLREGTPIGVFGLGRRSVRPFSESQIELVTTFADQAVIAIENVRLFDEVQKRTRELSQSVGELRALGEVSQAINSTLDVETVLTTIVVKAVQLSGTEAGAIYTFDQSRQEFRLRATHGMDEAIIAAIQDRGIRFGETVIGKSAAERTPVQIADTLKNPSLVLDIIKQAGFRALLAVPLLRADQIIGVLIVRRKEPGDFPEHTVRLLQTFADQSVLTIQNARLFREIEDKSRQLEEASQHKSQFLANMSHELRTPLNAILGYTELMADGAYGEPSEKMLGILKRLEANGRHLLGLINDVLDLSKIEAGQLELELSDYCIEEIAQTVRSTLEPLAADKKLGFKVQVTPRLPPGRGDGRRLTQVLINLVGNAIKFTDAGEVFIKAEANNGSFHVSVRDTGPGISSTDQAKLFQEFQQADNAITKKKGGTGLGLAISKRIIEMHGGRIWVESQPGQGSTFTFTLPVIVERQVEAA